MESAPPHGAGRLQMFDRELPFHLRWQITLLVALRMAAHDRAKALGAILGVAFAFVLVGQNIASVAFYVLQATPLVENAGADLWIGAPATTLLGMSPVIPASALHQARVVPGVAWAEPLVAGVAAIKIPDGGSLNLVLVGTQAPSFRGGPFRMVTGDPNVLLEPNTLIFEDVERERLGGLNVGDTVELNGVRARVGGFTWGLLLIFGAMTFGEYDFVRSILHIDSDRLSYVLIGLEPGADLLRVQAELRDRIPEGSVMTTEEFLGISHHWILYDAGMGALLVMGLLVGTVVGFAIVGLSMVSAVQQNMREFGTLKALGATNGDFRRIILVQGLIYAAAGAFVGAALLCTVAWYGRDPHMNLVLHIPVLLGLVPFVTAIAICSALIALRPVLKLDPASVFR